MQDLAVVLGALQALRVSSIDAAAIEAKIQPMSAAGATYRHVALEILALTAQRGGDMEKAKKNYRAIVDDAASPPGIRARASQEVEHPRRVLTGGWELIAAISGKRLAAIALPLILLTGCESWLGAAQNKPLEGERIDVLRGGRLVTVDERIKDLKVLLPRPEKNAAWPLAGGYPNHAMHHLSASGPLTQQWSADIGEGSSDEALLLSQPVVSGGRIYTVDIDAVVSAFDEKTGNRLWQAELSKSDDDEGILAGGIAVEDGKVFATTGFAEIVALDARDRQGNLA